MFAAVRQYTYDPRHATEINRLVKERMLPTLRRETGFVAFYWLDSGSGAGASWIVFEQEADARAWLDKPADFCQTPACLLSDPPQTTVGKVIAFTNAGL